MITEYISQKIKLLSFVSIILVLYIHSGFHDQPNEIAGMTANFRLQGLVSGMLGRIAVPMFYFISGFLFFYGTENRFDIVLKKLRRRVHSILIPFLVVAPLIALITYIMELIPWAQAYMNSVNGFSKYFKESLVSLFLRIYIVNPPSPSPFAFHLWFLRDLIIVLVFSPLLWLINKRKVFLYLILLFSFLCMFVKGVYLPSVAFFFFISGYVFLPKMSQIKNYTFLVLATVYVLISIFIIFVTPAKEILNYINPFLKVMGVVLLWRFYDVMVSVHFTLNNYRILNKVVGFTFFIYLFHMPALNIVRKSLVAVMGQNSFSFAMSYILSPWIFVAIMVVIGVFLKRYLPRAYNLIVGGR